jgi:hypothetical protein
MSSESLTGIVRRIHNYKDRVSDKLDPASDMRVDRSDLDGEFVRQSELAASYGFLYASSEAEVNRVELQLSTLYAHLDGHVRVELGEKGRVTERMVENEVFLNTEYQNLKLLLIDSKENKRLLKAACDALDHKLQALINAGADHRKTFMDTKILEQKDNRTF